MKSVAECLLFYGSNVQSVKPSVQVWFVIRKMWLYAFLLMFVVKIWKSCPHHLEHFAARVWCDRHTWHTLLTLVTFSQTRSTCVIYTTSQLCDLLDHLLLFLGERQPVFMHVCRIAPKKPSIGFVMSVRMEQLVSHWSVFHEIWY